MTVTVAAAIITQTVLTSFV